MVAYLIYEIDNILTVILSIPQFQDVENNF